MAIRTTSDAVAKIVEVDTESVPDMSPFIETASALVDDECLASGYSDARLELIERWLSAHFYTVRDNRVANETADGVGEGFQYKIGLNLASSMQGQTAMMMDTAGNLAALSKAMERGHRLVPPTVMHIGKSATEILEDEGESL